MRLEKFHEDIHRYFPDLVPISRSANPEQDVITLPSTAPLLLGQSFPFPIRIKQWEILLRVGHGHDTLVKLRRALGIKSCLVRHHRRDHRGQVAVESGNNAISRADRNVRLLQGIYQQNWGCLLSLGAAEDELCGLQELGNDHLKILAEWIRDRDYRGSDSRLPWIWRVAHSPIEVTPNSAEFKTVAMAWSEEGALGLNALLDK